MSIDIEFVECTEACDWCCHRPVGERYDSRNYTSNTNAFLADDPTFTGWRDLPRLASEAEPILRGWLETVANTPLPKIVDIEERCAGWGTLSGFIDFLVWCIDMAIEHPDALVEVSV